MSNSSVLINEQTLSLHRRRKKSIKFFFLFEQLFHRMATCEREKKKLMKLFSPHFSLYFCILLSFCHIVRILSHSFVNFWLVYKRKRISVYSKSSSLITPHSSNEKRKSESIQCVLSGKWNLRPLNAALNPLGKWKSTN